MRTICEGVWEMMLVGVISALVKISNTSETEFSKDSIIPASQQNEVLRYLAYEENFSFCWPKDVGQKDITAENLVNKLFAHLL